MTNPDYTHLLIIADRSGSMESIRTDMNGGIATLLKEQAALPGTIRVDAWTFDSSVEHVASNAAATDRSLQNLIDPRGMTAMFDGIGTAVTHLGSELAKLDDAERPGKVVTVIVTDGHENASREYSQDRVKKMLTDQQDKYGWQVVFLGANIDSATVGGGIGLRGASTMDYMPTEQSVSRAFASTSSLLSDYRSGVAAAMVYTREDRDAAADAEPEKSKNKKNSLFDKPEFIAPETKPFNS